MAKIISIVNQKGGRNRGGNQLGKLGIVNPKGYCDKSGRGNGQYIVPGMEGTKSQGPVNYNENNWPYHGGSPFLVFPVYKNQFPEDAYCVGDHSCNTAQA